MKRLQGRATESIEELWIESELFDQNGNQQEALF